MASEKKKFWENWKLVEKIKKIKHFEIILVILLALIILVIWFWDWGSDASASSNDSLLNTSDKDDYAAMLETKLSSILSEINGAGSVSVMVTLDGSTELILAYTKDENKNSTENTTSSGTTSKTETINTSTSPIIINSSGSSTPLVLSEILPSIKGVVVLAEGANDIKVKLDILKAVQALLGVTSSQVEIFVKG